VPELSAQPVHNSVREPRESGVAPATVAQARRAVHAFIGWLDAFGELSHDPYDVWATALGARAKTLYYRRPRLGAVASAPFVLLDLVAPRARALFSDRTRSPISDAHYALAFFRLARAEGDASYVERGRSFLAALDAARSPGYDDPAWGYPFDWPSRYGLFDAGWPLITTSPYGYEAFEAGYAVTGDESYRRAMEGAARFAAEHFPVTEIAPGVEASAYTPFDRRQVVNASAYRGFLLAAAGDRFGRDDWLAAASRNLAFVLRSQRPDGSWPYSVDGADDFVDNFHTCLVLKNLTKATAVLPDEALRDAVVAGYAFYRARLIDARGLPVPFAVRPRLTLYRRDLYDYAEGINLARLLRTQIPEARAILERLVDDLVERWTLPDGHFVTRRLVIGRTTIPYHRWAQSQAFHALAGVAELGS
jgi:hypothetical protein